MPRLINNKLAVELGASYEDGEKPELIKSCDDFFGELRKEFKDSIVDLNNQLELILVTDKNIQVLEACNSIIGSINAYYESTIKNIGEINVSPVVDMKDLNNKLSIIMQMLMKEESQKEWDFEMVRDMEGKLLQVKAKEKVH